MQNQIVGRDPELKIFKTLLASKEPQMLAVYGRRRVGKTFLISKYFKDKGLYFEITGTKGGALRDQLFQFAYEFSRQFQEGNTIPTPQSWTEAFHLLLDAIEKKGDNQKIILFFDELPWLASKRSQFLPALEHFWNRYLSRNPQVILIICGSSASWIIKNIINNRGGLHGRVTQKMRLLPFTLEESETYLRSRHIDLDRKQLIDLYMAFGGVPKYLSYIPRGKSAAQIINELCFTLNGGLYNEFYNLYLSLFENHDHHIAIVKALAKTSEGLTKEEILSNTKLSSGGFSSRVLEELVDAGFVAFVPSFHKKKVGGLYRLIDEYSLFYLSWMEDLPKTTLESTDASYWIKKHGTPKWRTWSGYAFEAVCLKHLRQIKRALAIAGITTIEAGWRHKADTTSSGAQIDLVIDRADHCINLCEMKYTEDPLTLDKALSENLQHKKRTFRTQTGTRKTLFTTLITPYGVIRNSHYHATIDAELTMESLFTPSLL